ncbi:hypothetical protein EHW71_03580 [Clostridium butyricum]|jgi:3-methyladenine DNA glycosylase AlkD|uniref:hypothetical protein n=1 Tax=Clostridium butyricum TaxID=1492 RepID=UPI000F549F60|nr:hypothetical protein [Clostridium butyricum]RQN12311.1 hypothetical protein EHW71_03580 [Clostridium butyricum]
MASHVRYRVVIKDFEILNIDNSIINNRKIAYNNEIDIREEKTILNISLQEIEVNNKIFVIEVTSDKDLFEQELMPLAMKYVDNLLNKIAFYFQNAKVGEPWILDTYFMDKKTGTTELPCSVIVSTENRDKKLLDILCHEIKNNKNFDKEEYNLFRAAMNNEDVVVKYMFLYQILSFKHLNSNGFESQNIVDDFIKSKFTEDKHMFQRWSDSGREETIYTRLRNQVGHFRGKTSQETRSVMNAKIHELIELVKMSI